MKKYAKAEQIGAIAWDDMDIARVLFHNKRGSFAIKTDMYESERLLNLLTGTYDPDVSFIYDVLMLTGSKTSSLKLTETKDNKVHVDMKIDDIEFTGTSPAFGAIITKLTGGIIEIDTNLLNPHSNMHPYLKSAKKFDIEKIEPAHRDSKDIVTGIEYIDVTLEDARKIIPLQALIDTDIEDYFSSINLSDGKKGYNVLSLATRYSGNRNMIKRLEDREYRNNINSYGIDAGLLKRNLKKDIENTEPDLHTVDKLLSMKGFKIKTIYLDAYKVFDSGDKKGYEVDGGKMVLERDNETFIINHGSEYFLTNMLESAKEIKFAIVEEGLDSDLEYIN